MEYTSILEPLLVIFISFLIGLFVGVLLLFKKMNTDNELLQIDLDIIRERLQHCKETLDSQLNTYKDDDYEAY